MSRSNALAILALLGVLSCQPRREPTPEPKQYSVPAEVEPYVKAFREVAQTYGQTLPSDNLIITFGQPNRADACAQCTLAAGKTPRITIKMEDLCWKNASAAEREALVFHELGHCWLKRDHRDDRFPNGAYASLMNSDDITVYAVCRYPIGEPVCDKRPRRAYYLDELFNPATPAPTWAR